MVVPLEVPRTEMVSLQFLVARHRNTGIQKQLRKPGQASRETTGKKVSENGVDLGILGGVDLAWIFWDRGKRAQKIHAKSTPVSGTKSAPFFAEKICAQIRAAKSKSPRRAPTQFPLCLLVPVF